LVSRVPDEFLHGYEAVYKLEKEQEKKTDESKSVDVLSGLRLLFKYPYVLGIFGMIFFYEIIDTMLNFKRLILTKSAATCMNELTCSLYGQVFYTHLFGFFLSFFGTNTLLRILGERWSLLCIPLFSLLMLSYYIYTGSSTSLILVYQGMTALNMAVSYPIREALYIPTVKEVRYKSKSWIDAFGTKLSKSLGSGFNKFSFMIGKSMGGVFLANAFGAFVAILGFFWLITAYLLGKRFSKAVEDNEVIGIDAGK
jgi:AAA family ATP:ADP antiporter